MFALGSLTLPTSLTPTHVHMHVSMLHALIRTDSCALTTRTPPTSVHPHRVGHCAASPHRCLNSGKLRRQEAKLGAGDAPFLFSPFFNPSRLPFLTGSNVAAGNYEGACASRVENTGCYAKGDPPSLLLLPLNPPTRAREQGAMRLRVLAGLKEVGQVVRSGRPTCVVLAPVLIMEEVPGKGGLDTALTSILSNATARSMPISIFQVSLSNHPPHTCLPILPLHVATPPPNPTRPSSLSPRPHNGSHGSIHHQAVLTLLFHPSRGSGSLQTPTRQGTPGGRKHPRLVATGAQHTADHTAGEAAAIPSQGKRLAGAGLVEGGGAGGAWLKGIGSLSSKGDQPLLHSRRWGGWCVAKGNPSSLLKRRSTPSPLKEVGRVSPYGEVKLENVLSVENLKVNLVSQSQLDDMGCKIFYDSGKVAVFGPEWEKYTDGYFSDGFYEMNLIAMNDKDEIYEDPAYSEMGELNELSNEVEKSEDSKNTGASVEAAVKQEEEIVTMEAAVNGGDEDGVNTFAAAIVVEDEAVNAKCEGVEAVKGDIKEKGSKVNAPAKGRVLVKEEHVEGYETQEVLGVEMTRRSERLKKISQGLDVKALNFKTRKQKFKVHELQGSVKPT
ncbi:unnamed protein product [Closterium sp. Naga37s-1]|nr:unnamed protein product [Closterium sp. Naga37s-1]